MLEQSLEHNPWILSKIFYAGAHDLLGIVVTMSGGRESSVSILFYT